jgi:hypothetical protein
VVALRSLFEGANYLIDAQQQVARVDFDAVEREHRRWWEEFWAKSWIDIGDPRLEQRYCLSTYIMGSACRDPEFPPALFGPWLTGEHAAWHGNYHLNYNWQAAWHGLYSGNHLEQARCYHAPVLAFIGRGQWYAKTLLNCRGVYYPIGLGPKGIETARFSRYNGNTGPGLFHQQKSNASYCLANMALHWYCTYDIAYGQTIYPFVVEVANFWEDYLVWEKDASRYAIHKDSYGEWFGDNLNPINSLGFVRCTLTLALDLSRELGVDAPRRAKWQHILDHLSRNHVVEKEPPIGK